MNGLLQTTLKWWWLLWKNNVEIPAGVRLKHKVWWVMVDPEHWDGYFVQKFLNIWLMTKYTETISAQWVKNNVPLHFSTEK